jgi:hypothetical protein
MNVAAGLLMLDMRRFTYGALALLALGSACDNLSIVCGDVFTYDEPVFNISSVTDSASGVKISDFTLSRIRISDRDLDSESLRSTLEDGPSYGATLSGSTISCTDSCGFGAKGGDYELTVSAPDHTGKRVAVRAGYGARTQGGCVIRYMKGTRIRVVLGGSRW